MRSAVLLTALAVTALTGCARRAPPPPAPAINYVIGAPYNDGGVWHYPRESFDTVQTGLGVRRAEPRGLTADGEAADPTALAGSHQTLQLPAIATVTNLENGRAVRVRLNDRGPADAGRLVGLSRRAADLLGMPGDGATQVRLEVESVPSQALRDRLQGGLPGIVAAPREAVLAESLSAPAGSAPPSVRVVAEAPPESVPDRLPETVQQNLAEPGMLWLRAGSFSLQRYAERQRARLSVLPVQVRSAGGRRGQGFVVMAGPFGSVAAADAALDQARAAGVTDAVIVVE